MLGSQECQLFTDFLTLECVKPLYFEYVSFTAAKISTECLKVEGKALSLHHDEMLSFFISIFLSFLELMTV